MARIAIDGACWANRRGYGRYARELMNAVWRIDHGNEYIMIADEATAGDGNFPRDVPSRVVRLGQKPVEAAGAGSARSITDMMRLGAAAREADADILLFPSVYTYFPYFGRGKNILIIHDAIPERHPGDVFPDAKSRLFWNIKTAMALRDASMLVTVSDHAKHELMDVFSLCEDDIEVVSEAPGHVFVESFGSPLTESLRKRVSLREGERFFLYVGGFGPHKNLERLLRVYETMHAGADAPKLVMVGDFEGDSFFSNHGSLREWLGRNGMERSVSFPGFVPDEELGALYANCIALLLPSKREGFGLPAVEAAAAGAPVIATIHSPLPNVLDGGGIFVDPDSDNQIAGAMRVMMNDADRRATFAGRAREAATALSWETSARRLLECFRKVAPSA
ncbi:glycosyltransferase family 4 protein [Candidatus Sumerlaeota bacterium]|nr:glycosyltransferase family 4 protein [Candidatus Sumerlaeota bacterium]